MGGSGARARLCKYPHLRSEMWGTHFLWGGYEIWPRVFIACIGKRPGAKARLLRGFIP